MADPHVDVSRTPFVLLFPFPRVLMQAVWKPLTVPFLPLVAVILLMEQLSMALSACLPLPLFCCGELKAATHQQQGAPWS